MVRPPRLTLLGPMLALVLAVGCKPAAVDDGSTGGETATATPTAAEAGADQGHDTASGATADEHDARTLRTIMQGLGMDMQAFSQALFVDDSARMVAHAAAMADHAHMLPSEVQRIQAILGPEMAAFEAADERVHLGAQRLHELAIAGQLDAAARQVGEVNQGCVACHDQFREKLRTDRQ
ncbi:MAG: hypothetical protein ACYC2G_10965 [Gemmatimonadaceae bacterium]